MEQDRRQILPYHLQWFAKDGPGGEKTEPATAKKLREAREDGKVAKSKELTAAFDLIVMFLMLKIFVSTIGDGFLQIFYYVFYFRIRRDATCKYSAGGVEGFHETDAAKAGPV